MSLHSQLSPAHKCCTSNYRDVWRLSGARQSGRRVPSSGGGPEDRRQPNMTLLSSFTSCVELEEAALMGSDSKLLPSSLKVPSFGPSLPFPTFLFLYMCSPFTSFFSHLPLSLSLLTSGSSCVSAALKQSHKHRTRRGAKSYLWKLFTFSYLANSLFFFFVICEAVLKVKLDIFNKNSMSCACLAN